MKLPPTIASNLPFALIVTISVALMGIVMAGAGRKHVGWVTAPDSNSQQHPVYESRVRGPNPLFQGNDVFRVQSPRIVASDRLVLSQQWDRSNHRGTIQFATARPLEAAERLPVVYRLGVRWHKVLPALLTVVALLISIAIWGRVYQDPQLPARSTMARRGGWILLIAVIAFSGWIIAYPGWSYGDDFFILNSTVRGNFLPAMVFPETGRFFPLGLIDLNLLIPFGDNPFAYHLERLFLLVLLCGTLYQVTTRTSGVAAGCFLVLVFLTTPELFKIYADSIFPESLLALLLAMFFWFYFSGSRSGNGFHLGLSCCVAAMATYCKEPVFGLFLVFAVVQLAFGFRQMTRSLRWTNIFLIINGLIFLALYGWICSGGGSYAEIQNAGMGRTRAGVLLAYLTHPWFLLSLGWCIWRASRLLVQRDTRLLKYDGALLAGIGYVVAFAILKLSADYYLIPAYVCWTAAFAGYLRHSQRAALTWKSSPARARFAATCGLLLVIGSVQLPGTVQGIHEAVQARADTRRLATLIGKLEKHGFNLYVFIPDEMTGFPAHVQSWRRRVVNTFDANARGNLCRAHSGQQPVQVLRSGDLPAVGQRSIVIHDPAFPNVLLNRSRPAGQQFQMVEFAPLLMGAVLYAPADCLEPIRAIASHHQTPHDGPHDPPALGWEPVSERRTSRRR